MSKKKKKQIEQYHNNIFIGNGLDGISGKSIGCRLNNNVLIIEYVGELVRPTFAEIREAKVYDDLVGAGTYVFRINPEYCVDATRTGNLAHLLNHSCDANCASRTITVKGRDGQPVDHVVIFADRDIQAGEELTYDYRFSGEEVLQCCCGSLKCRGKVNQSLPISFEGGWADARRLKSSLKRKQAS